MIIYHIEYDEFGEVDSLLTYDDVDTSFIEAEDSEIKAVIKTAPKEAKYGYF